VQIMQLDGGAVGFSLMAATSVDIRLSPCFPLPASCFLLHASLKSRECCLLSPYNQARIFIQPSTTRN